MNPRIAYFIMDTERAADGGFIPCIAVEGEHGFYKTDWNWGDDLNLAQQIVEERNTRLGISPKAAWKIVIGTMRIGK